MKHAPASADVKEIEELVRQADPQLAKRLTADKKKLVLQATRLVVKQYSEFSGPVPPADMLEAYGRVVENGAERIFRMAETQAEHRQGLESTVIRS